MAVRSGRPTLRKSQAGASSSPGFVSLVIHTTQNPPGKAERHAVYERLVGVPHCLRRVYRALSHLCPGSEFRKQIFARSIFQGSCHKR